MLSAGYDCLNGIIIITADTVKALLPHSLPPPPFPWPRTSRGQGQSFTLALVRGDEYTFTSVNGEDIRDLVNSFLDGLRKRSKFVIAMMNYQSPGEGSAFLSFRKGDLIHLESEDGEDVLKSGWCYGECERTGVKGDFPAECVYVLPAISRPPDEVLVRLCGIKCQECAVSLCICTCVSFLPPPSPTQPSTHWHAHVFTNRPPSLPAHAHTRTDSVPGAVGQRRANHCHNAVCSQV